MSRSDSDEDMADAPPAKKLNKGKGKAQENGQETVNLPWVEKYRPKDIEDVVSHQDIIATSASSKVYQS